MVSISTHRRASGLMIGALLAAAYLFVSTQTAAAFDCYVADKPDGAGAVTEADIKPAGESGNLVAPGAFISGDVTGAGTDIFIRGQQVDIGEPIVGIGTLPEQPHDAGSEEHGVLSLES